MTEEQVIRCSWPDCGKPANHQVFGPDGLNSAYLCRHHRCAALINLETYGTILTPLKERGNISQVMKIKPTSRPGDVVEKKIEKKVDWEQKAAQQADSVAKPIEQTRIEGGKIANLPLSRKKF